MRTLLLFIIFITTTDTTFAYNPYGDSYYYPQQIVSVRKDCHYDPNPTGEPFYYCNPQDCQINEIYRYGECQAVECIRYLPRPVQNENTCRPHPSCTGAPGEKTKSTGECIPCSEPSTFINDQCITCPEGQRFNYSTEQCEPITQCSEGYQLPHPTSTMCYPKCRTGYTMDVFGQCNKDYVPPPECPIGTQLVGDHCEPIEEETCDSDVKGAVNCLKQDVTNSIYDLQDTTTNILNQIKNILFDIDDNLNQQENGDSDNPDYDNPYIGDVDTSPLESEMPFQEIDIDNMLDDSIFNSSPQCPQNRYISVWAVSYEFSFERICDALDKLSYLVMAISVLLSVNIILRK